MKKFIAIVVVCSALTLSACSQSNSSMQSIPELTTEEAENQVEDAVMRAFSFKDRLTEWVTRGDAMRVSPKENVFTLVSVSVTDGVWKAEVSNPDAFDQYNNVKVMASGAENGTKAGKHTDTDNRTEALEILLANENTDLDNAYMKAALYNGRVKSVYFVNGSTSPIQELDDNIGDQAEWIDSSYPWSGKVSGMLSDGTIVGTAPMI